MKKQIVWERQPCFGGHQFFGDDDAFRVLPMTDKTWKAISRFGCKVRPEPTFATADEAKAQCQAWKEEGDGR